MGSWAEVDSWREKQVSGDVPRTAPAPKKKDPVVWRDMTLPESKLILALSGCRFTPGCFDKRFARDLYGQLDGGRIAEKQAALLRKMVTRYRRQIRADAIAPEDQHLLTKASSPNGR